MKLSRVHPLEWIVGLMGLVVVVGFVANVSSFGPLHVIVLLVAGAGILLPIAVAASTRTNVPVVYETLLWIVSGLVALVLLVKALIPSDEGFDPGYLALAGTIVMSFALWRSVAREQ